VPPCASEENLCPRGKLKNLCYIAGKVLQIRLKLKNPQNFSPAAGSSVYSYLGKFVPPRKIEKFVLHCWKSAPNTTEDQTFSTFFACGGQLQFSVIHSSGLNSITLATLMEKVLQIRPKIKNIKNFRLWRTAWYASLRIKWLTVST